VTDFFRAGCGVTCPGTDIPGGSDEGFGFLIEIPSPSFGRFLLELDISVGGDSGADFNFSPNLFQAGTRTEAVESVTEGIVRRSAAGNAL